MYTNIIACDCCNFIASFIAVADRMFLEMQDYDLPKYRVILPKFNKFYQKKKQS